jgi:hypothetical protein
MSTLKGKNVKGALEITFGMLRVIAKDGTEYRMSIGELDKLLRKHDYDTEMKRKYAHLTLKE